MWKWKKNQKQNIDVALSAWSEIYALFYETNEFATLANWTLSSLNSTTMQCTPQLEEEGGGGNCQTPTNKK